MFRKLFSFQCSKSSDFLWKVNQEQKYYFLCSLHHCLKRFFGNNFQLCIDVCICILECRVCPLELPLWYVQDIGNYEFLLPNIHIRTLIFSQYQKEYCRSRWFLSVWVCALKFCTLHKLRPRSTYNMA